MFKKYDFIVVELLDVLLLQRLANSPAKPTVLLLEAGGSNDDESLKIPADRFSLAFSKPELNWGFKTVPQRYLKNREIDYSRGKGLGGSTAINFCGWFVGSSDDYDEWARLVDDSTWNWENVKERFKEIETYGVDVPKEFRKYINPNPADHGRNGPLKFSYAKEFEKGVKDVFEAMEESGLGLNLDLNSGSPLGFGMPPSGMYKGSRVTASTAYLSSPLPNLTIVLHAVAAKVIFIGTKAVGIRTTNGQSFFASKEIILSAGALNSPQLLMLSGIGPKYELSKHGIPCLKDLPQVGKNLQDHCFSTSTLLQKPGTNDRMTFSSDTDKMTAAKAQYEKDKTGILTSMNCAIPAGWFKSDAIYASKEFAELDTTLQKHLHRKTIPLYEILTHTPPLCNGGYDLKPTDSYLCCLAFVMNPQSRGEVTLRSSDPLDAPVVDPNLFSHPYDRRVAIEAMRSMLSFMKAPALAKTTVQFIGTPKSDSDEDIWEHYSQTAQSSWHMCGTIIMGNGDHETSCVDSRFRVLGVENLRVADLSVVPLLPNNHTQSTAYLIGETICEQLIAEYNLNEAKEKSWRSRL